MKKLVILSCMLLFAEATIAQNPCVNDTLLNADIKRMYTFLNILDTATLSPFITRFIERDGHITDSLRIPTMHALERNERSIDSVFRMLPDTCSCFQYSVNKELHDYTIALTLLARELTNFSGKEKSGFRYNQVLSVYHHLVAARSALMAIMDATSRYFKLQDSIEKSEKRVKRHITRWGAVTIAVVGIACIIQLAGDE